MLRPIVIATLLAGTLDILGAFLLSSLSGMGPVLVLQLVASGPLGNAAMADPAYAAAGIIIHFAMMAAMVTVYMLAARQIAFLRQHPVVSGAAYGLGLWLLMYWIILPIRWPSTFPPTDAVQIVGQLFCHVVLVGIPIGLIASRAFKQPQANVVV
jgi:hypothetical protein